MVRGSFVFDQNKCTGCHACRLACTIENRLSFRQSWRQVHTFNPARLPVAPVTHLSLACNHCADPACQQACPALAYCRDEDTGAVLLDDSKCIGCKYCSWACPYDAPQFEPSLGVMTKCTFCNDRLREGRDPACAELCPTGALSFAHLPVEEITNAAEGFPASRLRPAIKVLPWRDGLPPQMSGASAAVPLRGSIPRRVSLRTEWPLLAFTFIIASLFGALAAEVAGGVGVSAPIFLATALLGLALSGVHIGRKRRAWRSILNVTRSWLSREVLFVGLFVLSGACYLAVMPGEKLVGWVAIAMGFAALFSMDMVYRFAVRSRPRVPHSASMVLTGPLLAGVLLLNPAFMAVFGSSKAILYGLRKVGMVRDGLDWKPWASVVRAGIGLMGPAALWIVDAQGLHGLIILAVLLGEFVDRAEFYSELDFPSPQRQMKLDLEKRLSLAGDTRSSRQPAPF